MEQVYKKDGTLINLLQDVDIEVVENNGIAIKFSNGYMIAYGFIGLYGTFEDKGVYLCTLEVNTSFPVSCVDSNPVVCATISGATGGIYRLEKDVDKIKSITLIGNGAYGFSTIANYIAIGRWK